MKWIKDRFLNITLRSKLIWTYFIIALIPFVMIATLVAYFFVKQSGKNIFEHTDQMLNQVKTSIDVYISTIEKTSNYIMKEVTSSGFLTMKSEDEDTWEEVKQQISRMLFDIADTHKEVAGVLIATENDMYISTGMTRISRDSFTREDWYRQAVQNPNEIQMISNIAGRNIVTNKSYSIDNVFSLSKAIIDPATGAILGVILFDLKHDIISESIQSITLGEKGFIFVIDGNKNIVYTPTNKVIYRVNTDYLQGEDKAPITTRIDGEKYQIRQDYSSYTGWKIIGVFSLDDIMGSVNTMMSLLMISVLITLVGIVIISLKISQTITNPITQLKRLMRRAEAGDLSVRFDVRSRDEVSILGNNFNQMLDRIENLIHMVYQEQQNKRIAELKLLQEQIKPHFLYNTLDTINWMAREYEADDIVQLVDSLTSMYRIGLSHGKDYISLEDEIKYVKNYLYIQKLRYGNKLNYEVSMDENLENFEVPKLILQPLVENSIYHGIKVKRGEGHLWIRVRDLEGNFLELSVEDNGSGMTPRQVEELNTILNDSSNRNSNQSFGLFYIKERLKIRYGSRFYVQVESEKDVGTKVTIRLPKAGNQEVTITDD
ncbi:MAG: sensor histidine kinase [Mobilitalea sp.]